jgi:hypothetical protein
MFNLLYLNSNYTSHMTGVVCILIFMSISYSMHTVDYSMQTTGDVCNQIPLFFCTCVGISSKKVGPLQFVCISHDFSAT